MTEQKWPSMSGWRKREMLAKRRQENKRLMGDIRAARAANRMREEAVARREDPDAIDIPRVEARKTGETASPTVAPSYPDPENMTREDMVVYLKSHQVKVHPASKDETLAKKVAEVRDGTEETPAA